MDHSDVGPTTDNLSRRDRLEPLPIRRLTPDFGPDVSRLLIGLYRLLAAEGRPITPDEVEQLAKTVGVAPEMARMFVEQAGERNEEGAVVGIVGLSLNRIRTGS